MATSRRRAAPRDIGALFQVGTTGGLTDAQLLERFVGPDPEASRLAFAELVARHGPMVLRVCGGLLRDPHDAEDAFQATFLVLARRGRTIRKGGSAASWLHGVARRVALSARSAAARRRRHEQRAGATAEPSAEAAGWDDLGEVLQEEVERLPEAYRTAIVLCDLEGLTEGQAAQQLGWPIGTVRTRLSRGRERLRGRLTRRGLAPSIVGAAAAGPPEAATVVPAALKEAATEAVVQFATLGKAPTAAISTLTEGVLRAMFLTRLKVTAAILIAIGAASSLTIATGGLIQEKAAATPRVSAQEPPRRRTIPDKLEEPVAMIFPNETPLADVLQYVKVATKAPGDDAGLPIYVDPLGLQDAEASFNSTVTLNAENMPLRVTLAQLLTKLGLEYAAKEDVVIVSSPRRIAEERKEPPAEAGDRSPATAAVLARLGEPIPMPFAREVPLHFALRTIEQATRKGHPAALSILVDAVGLKEIDRSLDSAILVDLEGVSLKTTLRLMLKQVGLAYAVKDGLVIVSSPRRLQQLRGMPAAEPTSTGSPKE